MDTDHISIIEDSKLVKAWIEDGIVFIIYKKDCIITLDIAKKLVETRLTGQQGKDYPGLAYVEDTIVMTPEARKYLATEGYKGVTKVAIITLSKLKSILANIFIMVDRPLKPTRLFTNKSEAVKWLKAHN